MKKIALTLVFCLFLGVFSVGSIILPDREFSENENRNLMGFPKPTAAAVGSGDWQGKINSWYSDQLLGRDSLIALKTRLEKLCGKREIGGVYLCHQDFYMEKKLPTEERETVFQNNLSAVSRFFRSQSENFDKDSMTFMLVPPAAYTLKNLLPQGAETPDYQTAYSKAEGQTDGFLDIREPLAENSTANYYKTDHHWTTDGAFAAYKAYCKAKSIDPKDFQREEISGEFLGTTHSKVLDSAATPDSVVYYKNRKDKDYTVTADGKTLDFGIYDFSRLDTKDKYAFFLGGNYGKVTVENCGGEGHLLLVKDSFANCFLPFLLPHFETVTVIDPRYFVGSVAELIKAEEITEILILYGADTFMEEKTVPAILS